MTTGEVIALIKAFGGSGGGGGGSSVLVVNVTEESSGGRTVYTLDKTAGEILSAANANDLIIIRLSSDNSIDQSFATEVYCLDDGDNYQFVLMAIMNGNNIVYMAEAADAYPQNSGMG